MHLKETHSNLFYDVLNRLRAAIVCFIGYENWYRYVWIITELANAGVRCDV